MPIETNFPLKSSARSKAIQAWWQVFGEKENQLNSVFSESSNDQIDIAEFMDQYFNVIHRDLCWEYGPGEKKAHRLAIAPERDRQIYPLADQIVSQAPELQHFEICLNRPSTSWEDYIKWTDGRLSWRSPEGIRFTANIGEHNLIDLVFYTQTKHQDDRTYDNCFIMAETLLGEEVVSNWIGNIDLEEAQKSGIFGRIKPVQLPSNSLPVSKLKEAVANHIAQIKNALPKAPLFERADDCTWMIIKSEPKELEDYSRMDDMLVMSILELGPGISLYNGQGRFFSERFSALGETFIFVKIDGAANDVEGHLFEDRNAMQDALDVALGEAEIGGTIAGATGQRYSYIFLAVTDLGQAVPLIKAALRSGRITQRSWIMFNDHTREQEWIGIWDDSPEPLLPSV